MLHAVGVALQSALRGKGCPLPVVDGPEPLKTAATFARERIVLERDDSDGFEAAAGARTIAMPRGPLFRQVGAKLTIYARSPRVGALSFEHYERAENALDLVLAELDGVLRGDTFQTRWSVTGGGFVRPVDLENAEAVAGAAYELRFAFLRGTPTTTWTGGAAFDTATLGPDDVPVVTSPRDVSINGEDAETF
jgi:hypothetical protein